MPRLDLRHLVAALIIVILVIFGIWRPWEGQKTRTIEVTGQAQLSGAPDEFTFNATYQKTAATQKDAITAVSTVGNDVVNKLKELGVEEKNITTNVSTTVGYAEPSMPITEDLLRKESSTPTAIFSVTAVVNEKELAQKVTDYIGTTPVQYSVSPQYGFSNQKRQELESQARLLAIADGRKKAEDTATALGVELGKVQKISEIQWGGGIFPLEGKIRSSDSVSSPIILPGEQDLTFTVTLTYSIR